MLNTLRGAPNVSHKFESGSMLKLLIRYFHLKVNPCKVLPECHIRTIVPERYTSTVVPERHTSTIVPESSNCNS